MFDPGLQILADKGSRGRCSVATASAKEQQTDKRNPKGAPRQIANGRADSTCLAVVPNEVVQTRGRWLVAEAGRLVAAVVSASGDSRTRAPQQS
jgi:hypothetical protein